MNAHSGMPTGLLGYETRKVAVVLGTRPEIIKLAPVIQRLGRFAEVIHTGQHYDAVMADRIGAGMGLVIRGDGLGVGGDSRGSQLGNAVRTLDERFRVNSPIGVVVQGDTTSALAGALAANTNGLPLLHVEAGLRSFDRSMPEESNRVLIDHVADVCCAPTEVSRRNLLREGVSEDRIVVTGNTVVEAVHEAMPDEEFQSALLRRFGLHDCAYLLVTLHRPENVDDRAVLKSVLVQLDNLDVPTVLPLHPRTRRRIAEFGLRHFLRRLLVIEPLEYSALLALAQGAALIVSDSGGLQEEASVLKRPIVVVRRSTERPEILGTFGIRARPGAELVEIVRQWLAPISTQRIAPRFQASS